MGLKKEEKKPEHPSYDLNPLSASPPFVYSLQHNTPIP